MNLSFLILIFVVCLQLVRTCDPDQRQHGCKIYGVSCTCGYGCKKEYVFRSRRACISALRARSSTVCHQLPCLRGICVQTVQEPGFSCKCEGSGFFGLACEKMCPTVFTRGLAFPHECIIPEDSSVSLCHVSGGLISKLCKLLMSLPKTKSMSKETLRKVTSQYNCAGWCTRIIASNSTIPN